MRSSKFSKYCSLLLRFILPSRVDVEDIQAWLKEENLLPSSPVVGEEFDEHPYCHYITWKSAIESNGLEYVPCKLTQLARS